MMRVSKEDVLLFGCYGMRGSGKSYIEKLKEKDKEIERLKKENNILKKNAEHNDKVVDNVNWENMFFKKIISKAIEYIKDYLCSYDYISAEFKNIAQVFINLLDTLKGVDKE